MTRVMSLLQPQPHAANDQQPARIRTGPRYDVSPFGRGR
jgi:hypothetical protein